MKITNNNVLSEKIAPERRGLCLCQFVHLR